MISTGYEQELNDDYDAVTLVCPREGCGATNVSVISDRCRCHYCGYESEIERFIPEVMDEESYHGY